MNEIQDVNFMYFEDKVNIVINYRDGSTEEKYIPYDEYNILCEVLKMMEE